MNTYNGWDDQRGGVGKTDRKELPEDIIKNIEKEADDLVNDDGDTPRDENQIIDYLRWSLSKTGLSLTIAAIFNIRERFATPNTSDDSGDGHFFKWNYLDAKTFEAS